MFKVCACACVCVCVCVRVRARLRVYLRICKVSLEQNSLHQRLWSVFWFGGSQAPQSTREPCPSVWPGSCSAVCNAIYNSSGGAQLLCCLMLCWGYHGDRLNQVHPSNTSNTPFKTSILLFISYSIHHSSLCHSPVQRSSILLFQFQHLSVHPSINHASSVPHF